MRKKQELLRLHFEANLSNEKVALCLGIFKGFVHKILARFKQQGLSWPLPDGFTETQLEQALSGTQSNDSPIKPRPMPDFEWVADQLQKCKHATTKYLWQQYRQDHPDGMGLSRFCELFTQYIKQNNLHSVNILVV